MARDAATQTREGVGRPGGLGEGVGSVDLVEFARHKVISAASLKVNTEVDMLSTLTAADRAYSEPQSRRWARSRKPTSSCLNQDVQDECQAASS